MKIMELPDLCHLLIFDKLEMSDLHKIGQTCRSWNALKFSTYKRIQVLAIHVKQEHSPNLKIDSLTDKSKLTIRHLTEQKQHKLLHLFPNVRVLAIKGELAGNKIDSIANLLAANQFTSKLVSLKLNNLFLVFKNLDFRTLSHHPLYEQLVRKINSLSSLKHLSLCFSIPSNQLAHLSIVSQLESFNYRSLQGGLGELAHLLKQTYKLPSGLSTLKKIEVSVYDYSGAHSFVQLQPEIARKVARLKFTSRLDKSVFERFCALFTSLTSVDLFLIARITSKIMFTERVNCLSKLEKLKFLKLAIDEPIEFDASQLETFWNLRHLHLYYGKNDQTDFLDRLRPAEKFPNITTFSYSDYKSYTISDTVIDHQKKILLHLAGQFKGCAKLRRIEYANCFVKVGQDGFWDEFGTK